MNQRLSPTQIQVMENIRDHGDPCFSFRSVARGGAMASYWALLRRGLVASGEFPEPWRPVLTQAGIELLAKESGRGARRFGPDYFLG